MKTRHLLAGVVTAGLALTGASMALPYGTSAQAADAQHATLNCHGATAVVTVSWNSATNAEVRWKLTDSRQDGLSPTLKLYASNPREPDPPYPFAGGKWPMVNTLGSGQSVSGGRSSWDPASFGDFESLEIVLTNGTDSQGKRCIAKHRIHRVPTAAHSPFNVAHGVSSHIEGWDPFGGRVMQSFGQDPATGDMFVLGVHSGSGDTLPPGSMMLTSFSASGQRLDSMVLERFGHGATMGVEGRGENVFIWSEGDANPDSPPTESYGCSIARFMYAPGQHLNFDRSRASIECLPPRPTAAHSAPRPVVDQKAGKVWIRWTLKGVNTFREYNLTGHANGCARAASWAHTKEFRAPAVPAGNWPALDRSQGTAIHDGYLYLLFGGAQGKTTSLFTYKIPSSGEATLVQGANELTYYKRLYDATGFLEPEGLAVLNATTAAPFLAPGFAYGKPELHNKLVAIAKLPVRLGKG